MSEENRNINSSRPAGEKKPLMTEEQCSRLYGLFFAMIDLKERQKICEAELSKLIQELYPAVDDEKQKEFIKNFGPDITK